MLQDPDHLASDVPVFIDSTTLPLHRDPILNVCDILAAWRQSAEGPIIYTITYRRNVAKTKWVTAGSLQFLSQGPQDCKSPDLTLCIHCDIKMPHREFA
jgi:hypothetical protein